MSQNVFAEVEAAGQDQLEEELLESRIKIMSLQTRLKLLENIEIAARRYVCGVDRGKRKGRHKRAKDSRKELVFALADLEVLDQELWDPELAD